MLRWLPACFLATPHQFPAQPPNRCLYFVGQQGHLMAGGAHLMRETSIMYVDTCFRRDENAVAPNAHSRWSLVVDLNPKSHNVQLHIATLQTNEHTVWCFIANNTACNCDTPCRQPRIVGTRSSPTITNYACCHGCGSTQFMPEMCLSERHSSHTMRYY